MALIFDLLLMDEAIRLEQNELRKREYRALQRNLRDAANPFELPDRTFIKLFRLDKHTCKYLIDSLSNVMNQPQRISAVPNYLKILCTLHFLGHGSYQTPTSQVHQFALSQPVVSRSIAEVTDLLVTYLLGRHIRFPSGVDLEQCQDGFRDRFPQFVHLSGIIDCTHIKIISPPADHPIYPAAPYYCHKGYYSINTQIICDSSLKIINMNARFPGSVHDSAIWQISSIREILRREYVNGQRLYLFGDSGYSLEPWLLVPYAQFAEGSPESRFNRSLSSARILIEHTNGLLKARFRCTLSHRALHFDPIRSAKIIYSCGILHNLAVERNIEVPEDDDEIIMDEDNYDVSFNLNNNDWFQAGFQVRQNIKIKKYYY